MDFGRNLVLKENWTFLVASRQGAVNGGERGLYSRDTRYLSRYRWRTDRLSQLLLLHYERPDRAHLHFAVMHDAAQVLALQHDLSVGALTLAERVRVTNDSLSPQSLTLTLEFATDFADLFEARGWHETPVTALHVEAQGANSVRLSHEASDGLRQAVTLRFTPAPSQLDIDRATFELELLPGASTELKVQAVIDDPLEEPQPAVTYDEWRSAFRPSDASPARRAVLSQAVDDLRALLLFTDQGPLPAAGIPWFVTAFGRDALLTATMLLPHHPQLARGTLRYFAARQGKAHDEATAEAPGKVLHEVRQGELARTGVIPFGRYYGTVDATPLFVNLLHATYLAEGDLELLRELEPNLRAAMRWIEHDADLDGDGFLEFHGAREGEGLAVQSWKDSHDALSHADGRLASGAIAVSEVQGYAYAAYVAAAAVYRALGEPDTAAVHEERAERLRRRFHEAFWLPERNTYALALDHDKSPLEVLASDAGQLLWTGIVPEEAAPALAATLMSPALFSGWGIRTLGTDEIRYNPLSYHNGSVWPHDTALIAAGLHRYGFEAEAETVRAALFDLAASQEDLRPPELVAGYPRTSAPPVPYPVACRPQAWSAAGLVYLHGLW
ncbi:MAG: amylo-alpha-1,6-glucosidase [Deinococcales bacterium]|nr:amylo-alpha-1,6-glucosidase [Deinococcales bacterium]